MVRNIEPVQAGASDKRESRTTTDNRRDLRYSGGPDLQILLECSGKSLDQTESAVDTQGQKDDKEKRRKQPGQGH